MKPIFYRYAVQRKSDKKFYKNPTAIYEGVEEYWTNDISKARLWLNEPAWRNSKLYQTVRFKLTLDK